MKVSLETVFNNSGSDQHPLKQVFLSQRKWILLCAGIIFSIGNDYLRLDQKWLFATFNIGSWSTDFLNAVALTGLFFSAYMWLSAYAFLKKHRSDNRQIFDGLEVQERDTHSSRIADLQSEKSKVETDILTNDANRSKLESRINADRAAIERLETMSKSLPDPFYRIPVPKELKKRVNEADREPMSILSFSDDWSTEEFEEGISTLGDRVIADAREVRTSGSIAEALSERLDAISEAILSATAEQTKVIQANDKEWKKFYRRRAAADFVALVPSIIGTGYCGYYLATGRLW